MTKQLSIPLIGAEEKDTGGIDHAEIFRYIDNHEERYLRELKDFYPVSYLSANTASVKKPLWNAPNGWSLISGNGTGIPVDRNLRGTPLSGLKKKENLPDG